MCCSLGNGPPLVLVVDDLPVNRLIIKHMCTKLGFGVLEAANGLEALHVFSLHPHEVCAVFMDLKMPLMSGWECAFQLRALENMGPRLGHAEGCNQPRITDGRQDDDGAPTCPSVASHPTPTPSSTPKAILCHTGMQSSHSSRDALHHRIPIIACTSTHPSENMSWRIAKDGAPRTQPYATCANTPDITPPLVPQLKLRTAPATPLAGRSPRARPSPRPLDRHNAAGLMQDAACAYACEPDFSDLLLKPSSGSTEDTAVYPCAAGRNETLAGTGAVHFLDADNRHSSTSLSFMLDDDHAPSAGAGSFPAAASAAGLPAGQQLSKERFNSQQLRPGPPPPPPPSNNWRSLDSDSSDDEHEEARVAMGAPVACCAGMFEVGSSLVGDRADGTGVVGGDHDGCGGVWCTSTVGQAARFAGIDEVLVKPLRMAELQSTLDVWVPQWRQRVAACEQVSSHALAALRSVLPASAPASSTGMTTPAT